MSPRSGQLFQALQKELSQSIWSVFSKTFSRVVALFNMEQLFPGESVIVLSCGLFSWPPERQNASSIDCASEEQNATHLPWSYHFEAVARHGTMPRGGTSFPHC